MYILLVAKFTNILLHILLQFKFTYIEPTHFHTHTHTFVYLVERRKSRAEAIGAFS